MIPKHSMVRVQTTNGGETVARLWENYRPTYDVMLYHNADNWFVISANRIKSVENLEGGD